MAATNPAAPDVSIPPPVISSSDRKDGIFDGNNMLSFSMDMEKQQPNHVAKLEVTTDSWPPLSAVDIAALPAYVFGASAASLYSMLRSDCPVFSNGDFTPWDADDWSRIEAMLAACPPVITKHRFPSLCKMATEKTFPLSDKFVWVDILSRWDELHNCYINGGEKKNDKETNLALSLRHRLRTIVEAHRVANDFPPYVFMMPYFCAETDTAPVGNIAKVWLSLFITSLVGVYYPYYYKRTLPLWWLFSTSLFALLYSDSWVMCIVYIVVIMKFRDYFNEGMDRLRLPAGCKSIPLVGERLPLIGHGKHFQTDIIRFVKACEAKYGPIFRIQVWNCDMVVCTSAQFVDTFFKQREPTMSLVQVLQRLYFGSAFSDDAGSLPRIIKLVKGSIAVDDDFLPKIMIEAQRLAQRLKRLAIEKRNTPMNLSSEMIRFVACTSARCFMNMTLTEDFYFALTEFTKLLNHIVVLTYFMPRQLLRLIYGRRLANLRNCMTNCMIDEIEAYRRDPMKRDSLVFRKAVDEKLTNQQVGEVIVCLLYVSSENTALGLAATMTDLANSAKLSKVNAGDRVNYWDLVAQESAEFLERQDMNGIFKETSTNSYACIMESARMTSHVFALNRKPMKDECTLGGYYIPPEVDGVGLCEPLLMLCGDAAKVKFSNPGDYNPARYRGEQPDSFQDSSVMTWGAGTHRCPGKNFALYEIRAALAVLTTVFEPFELVEYGRLDYFSPSAFAERKVRVILNPRTIHDEKDVSVASRITSANNTASTNGGTDHYLSGTRMKHKIETVYSSLKGECHSNKEVQRGWILRGYLSSADQEKWYQTLWRLSQGTEEHEILSKPNANEARAYALFSHNMIYLDNTRRSDKSSASSSTKADVDAFLDHAKLVWNELLNHQLDGKKTTVIPESQIPSVIPEFDSMNALLFGENAKMASHKDQYVTWGVSYNLGASVNFQFGETPLNLHSGDILVADFSKVEHAVTAIHAASIPGWWSLLASEENDKTFGKSRCSIQIRNVSNIIEKPSKYVTSQEFDSILSGKGVWIKS